MSAAAGPQNTLAWELPKRVVASPARKVVQPFDSAGGH